MAKTTTTTKKSTKKAAPKTSVKPRTTVQSHAVAKSKVVKPAAASTSAKAMVDKKTETTKTPAKAPVAFRKSYVILVIFMLALGALLYYARGIFVAAVVNGQPISRISVVKEAEKQSGKQSLDTIIRNTLIEQEARKQKITISEKELDDEVKKIEQTVAKQGQKLDDVLVTQGLTRTDLRRLIRLDKLVGKIVGRDIVISDKDVDAYIEKNKDLLPQDQTEEQWRATAKTQLKQDKLNEKVQAWLESIHNKAKILYFVQY